MRRVTRPSLAFAVVAVLLASACTWSSGVTTAQDHDHGHDHGGEPGGGDPGDGPPHGPPEPGRNPDEQRREVRYGPFNVAAPGPGEHHGHTEGVSLGVQKPCTGCQITSMTARLVDAEGQEVGNPQGLQLHHVVLLQQRFAGRDDATCGSGANWQPTPPSSTPLGLVGERFFASGDERAPVVLPRGYGYPVNTGSGGWSMLYELANGNTTSQNVYIEVVYDYVPGDTLHNVDPVWFDIDQCGDSEVSIGAGEHTRSYTWNVTRPGAVFFGMGHQHGNWVDDAIDGGVNMELRIGGPDGQVICDSRAGYGESPFYTDNHGMTWLSSMSACGDPDNPAALGVVGWGQPMTLTSHYSHQTTWPGQMGIMLVYNSQVVPEPPEPGPGGYPYDEDIRAELDGALSVDLIRGDESVAVPTGGEGVCNPAAIPTTLTGSFGDSHDGHAVLSDIEVTAQPGDLHVTDDGRICAVVDLDASGGEIMAGNGSGTFSLGDVTAQVGIMATGVFAPFVPGDCVLEVDIGPMTGTISGDGPPNQAELSASGVTVQRAPEECGAYGTLLNAHLALPTTNADIALDLVLHWEAR